MAPPLPRRRRLLLTIYLVAVIQLAVAGIAIVVVQRVLERAPWQHEPARQKTMLDVFAEFYDAPDALSRALAKLSDIDVAFYNIDGTLRASTKPALPPLGEADRLRLEHVAMIFLPTDGPVPITVAPVMREGKMVGYGMVHRRRPSLGGPPPPIGPPPLGPHAAVPPPLGPPRARPPEPLLPPPSRLPIVVAVALLGAAVTSVLFARSLARPLDRLAAAARAFGGGDLSARANLRRDDELGEVARTFDDMANRVNAMLHAQREFLANVSHELRTPLARIRVALDLAAEGDQQMAAQALSEIGEDWRDLDRLVEDVLTVARFDLAQHPDSAAIELRYEAVDASELVDRAAAAFRRGHTKRQLVVEPHTEPLPCYADRAMLRRVLDNLLNNAAAYSDAQQPIRLGARRLDDRMIEFFVEDRGIGIGEADIPKLFTPFFRTDRSRARKSGGVGLGLALVRRIVEAHGGQVAVKSTLGEGTTMTFRLPVEPSPVAGAPHASA